MVLRRAELLSVLRDAAFGAEIHLGARCVGFEQNERRAKAFLADGSSVEGDLLIGADGLHSVIRAQLFGPREPRYAGYVAWRAITEFEHGRLTPGISLGRGSQFGQVPLKEINESIGSRLAIHLTECMELLQIPTRSACSFRSMAQTGCRTDRSNGGESYPPNGTLRPGAVETLGSGESDIARRCRASNHAGSRTGRLRFLTPMLGVE